jgi:hypothetical protein
MLGGIPLLAYGLCGPPPTTASPLMQRLCRISAVRRRRRRGCWVSPGSARSDAGVVAGIADAAEGPLLFRRVGAATFAADAEGVPLLLRMVGAMTAAADADGPPLVA